MLVLDGQVFRQEIIGAANDKLSYQLEKFCKSFVSLLTVLFRSIRVTTTKNRKNRNFILLPKFIVGT